MHAGDAQTRTRRLQLSKDARIIFKAPDVNMGDLEKAMQFPGYWRLLGSRSLPMQHDITLVDEVTLDTQVDSTRSSNTTLLITADARIEFTEKRQNVLRIDLQKWVEQVGLPYEPEVWLISGEQPKDLELRWYKNLLQSADCPPSFLRGWTIGDFTAIRMVEPVTCNIPITW